MKLTTLIHLIEDCLEGAPKATHAHIKAALKLLKDARKEEIRALTRERVRKHREKIK